MSIHNTVCAIIYNFTTTVYNVVNQESGNSRVIPAKNPDPPNGDGQPGSVNFAGVIFPWCSNGVEIRDRAFIFRIGRTAGQGQPMFYMYQRFDERIIYWTPAPGPLANPSYPGRRGLPRPASEVNVRILSDNTPRVDLISG
jgi:hypothetical protein